MSEYKLRRDSLISPWGIGAIAPFPHDESLMIAGIDRWFDDCTDQSVFEIEDFRLSERMQGKRFFCPPDYRTRTKENNEIKIPAVRFPLWNYCPICGNAEKLTPGAQPVKCRGDMRRRGSKQSYCNKNIGNSKKLRNLIPERFIAVCPSGHIEDFPIAEWIHQDGYVYHPDSCRINRSTGGGSASLAGIRYTCTCGATRSMAGAFSKGALDRINYYCHGNHPWIAGDNDICGKPLLVLQRGASNVWYPEIVSSINIPSDDALIDKHTADIIKRVVAQQESSKTDNTVDISMIKQAVNMLNTFNHNGEADEKLAVEKIVEKLQHKDDIEKDEEYYRSQEFAVLRKDTGTPKDDLYVQNYKGDKYRDVFFLNGVSLVHKLKETRVFCGFRRMDYEAELVDRISSKPMDWLPAIQNKGEGILLDFDYDKLEEWASKQAVKERITKIDKNIHNTEKALNPVFILLHTFAHCLINALANNSGYSSASIREKIYCCQYKGGSHKMAGILIYTASGDSEGSLGGLVRQGLPGRLESIIYRAINESTWCASDPVCIQSPGQGQDGCNLAACHNCALLPETSCECRNKLLDRGVMIGTLENASIGYFSEYMDTVACSK